MYTKDDEYLLVRVPAPYSSSVRIIGAKVGNKRTSKAPHVHIGALRDNELVRENSGAIDLNSGKRRPILLYERMISNIQEHFTIKCTREEAR